jgi:hypothetical protein
VNDRDAFDEWLATEPAALHNLTIAEVYMSGWTRGRAHERELADPGREPCETGHGPRGCCRTRQLGPHAPTCHLPASAQAAMGDHEMMFSHAGEVQPVPAGGE